MTESYLLSGGYPKFLSQGLNEDYLPLWLQAAGYNTYYTGKLMNSYSGPYCNQTYPKGFNSSRYVSSTFMVFKCSFPYIFQAFYSIPIPTSTSIAAGR